MREIGRLVSPRGGFGVQITGQEIRAVSLEQQPTSRNLAHQRQKVCASTFVADPTGNPDRKVHLEIARELRLGAGKTVRHTSAQTCAVLAENRNEVLVCVPFMQKNRLADPRGQLELAMKRGALRLRRREIPKVIETAFADGHDLVQAGERLNLRKQIVGNVRCVVWVHARRCEQSSRVRTRQGDRLLRAGTAGPRYDHLYDTGGVGALQNRVTVDVVTVVTEVDTDVYEGRQPWSVRFWARLDPWWTCICAHGVVR